MAMPRGPCARRPHNAHGPSSLPTAMRAMVGRKRYNMLWSTDVSTAKLFRNNRARCAPCRAPARPRARARGRRCARGRFRHQICTSTALVLTQPMTVTVIALSFFILLFGAHSTLPLRDSRLQATHSQSKPKCSRSLARRPASVACPAGGDGAAPPPCRPPAPPRPG